MNAVLEAKGLGKQAEGAGPIAGLITNWPFGLRCSEASSCIAELAGALGVDGVVALDDEIAEGQGDDRLHPEREGAYRGPDPGEGM